MKTNFYVLSSFLILPAALDACDLCGCALATHYDRLPNIGIYAGANEQFTRYKTMQQDGRVIENDARQKLDSSITQSFLGYNVTQTFGVQFNAPFIRRTFRRSEETGIETGSVGGLGDVSILANWIPVFHKTNDFTFSLKLTGGLKFPTGDSDRVEEEGEEGHHSAEAETDSHDAEEEPAGHYHEPRTIFRPRHAGEEHGETSHEEGEESDVESSDDHPESGIHGHDLALGTGSLDGIIGGGVYARWQRLFVTGDVQYAIRGQGEHDYDFANDLLWSGGVGVFIIDRASHRLAVQFMSSGETKGEDEFRGVRSSDTSATNVFLGPKISASWRDRLTADVELDIPVRQENSGVQIVPDYRLRATVSWSF
jgi:hypothetical protein